MMKILKVLLGLALAAVLVAVAFFFLTRCGFKGPGAGGNGEGEGSAPTIVEEAQETDSNSEPQETESTEGSEQSVRFDIVIREREIILNGSSVGLDELETALRENYEEGTPVEVSDDYAIKATYDDVISLLNKLDIDYLTKNG